jgi:hypothetical protein
MEPSLLLDKTIKSFGTYLTIKIKKKKKKKLMLTSKMIIAIFFFRKKNCLEKFPEYFRKFYQWKYILIQRTQVQTLESTFLNVFK